ncbi:DMT family transporter [Stappia taiwanensis]|uniref:DMT family transporter n=1 Tax=Stappia taiwanensis TaxID=992267 RepID=A0A838XKX6_9HYPH|nr:DMT family transporter [Stappia taiwanensis]MBA4611175.1 DMT family transporter [Stappia taiwanensis]GGE86563.1 MFS transporter [Stappia taiwanensis]
MSRLLANTLLLLAALIWGSAFVAQSTAMQDLGPLTFTGLRFLIAAAVVLPFAYREGRQPTARPLARGHMLQFTLIGVVFFFAISLQQAGLVVTTVTNAGFLTGVYVVLTPILGLLVFREHPHPVVWPASPVTLGGIWLLGGGSLSALNYGDGLMIVCAVFWAIHVGLLGRVASTSGRPLALSVWQFSVVAVLALVAGFAIEEVSWQGIQAAGLELFYTSVISGGLAFTLQAIGQRWTRAGDAAILLSSEALFAALFGAIVLGERLSPLGLVGCALIFLAILAVQLVPLLGWRRLRLRFGS